MSVIRPRLTTILKEKEGDDYDNANLWDEHNFDVGGGGQSGGTMKGTRATATTTMKRARRKRRRERETAPGCDIMFTSNKMEVGVSEVKAAGYDKLLASRVEG